MKTGDGLGLMFLYSAVKTSRNRPVAGPQQILLMPTAFFVAGKLAGKAATSSLIPRFAGEIILKLRRKE